MYSAAYVWAKVLARLEQQLSEVTVSTWLDDAEVIELTQDRMVLYTPSDYRQEIIRSQCAPYIEDALEELLHSRIPLEVWGETELKRFKEETKTPDTIPLNPQFSFQSFVVGPENSFAKNITELAANDPGKKTHNPLLLYGDPGVGKTHLLYAAANRMIETRPELRVVCMKTEAFINEFINAIRNDKTEAFKAKLRQADVLLLDDIQFIAGKESTQEEFYHIFNALYERDRQIILTSDRRPSDMPTLAARLKDRFGEGIMVEVAPPGFDCRMQIVRQKAESYGLPLDEKLMTLICQALHNVRHLEGVLKKLRAIRELSSIHIDSNVVDSVIGELVSTHRPKHPNAEMILQQVCRHYHVSPQELRGAGRSKTVTEPRQMAMFLMHTMADMRYDDIAGEFNRDRATVIHSIKKVTALYAREDGQTKALADKLQAAIEEQSG